MMAPGRSRNSPEGLSGIAHRKDNTMTIRVNGLCQIQTGDHAHTYRRADGTNDPEITIGTYRLRLSIQDARALADGLAEALAKVAELEAQ